MENLKRSAQLLASDLASTIVFLVVLIAMRNLILAVATGVALGVAQIGWMLARGMLRRRLNASVVAPLTRGFGLRPRSIRR